MARLKMKRYLITSIVLVTFTASYFLYSLHSNHHPDRMDMDLEDTLPHQRVVVNVPRRDRGRQARKRFHFYEADLPIKLKHDAQSIKLFPEGLRPVDDNDHAADFEDSSIHGADRRKQQGKDRKGQGHKALSDTFSKDTDDDDMAPDQPVEHKLAAAAPKNPVPAVPPATASHQQLARIIQRNDLPKADRNGQRQDTVKKAIKNAVKAGQAAKDGVMKKTQHSADNAFKLAIDGIRKGKPKPVQENRPQKLKEVVDAERLFQKVQQKGRPQVDDRNVRFNRVPHHVVDDLQHNRDDRHQLQHNRDDQHQLQENRDDQHQLQDNRDDEHQPQHNRDRDDQHQLQHNRDNGYQPQHKRDRDDGHQLQHNRDDQHQLQHNRDDQHQLQHNRDDGHKLHNNRDNENQLEHNRDDQLQLQHNRDAQQLHREKSLPSQDKKRNVADALKKFEDVRRRQNVKVMEPEQAPVRHKRVRIEAGQIEQGQRQAMHNAADPRREMNHGNRPVQGFEHHVMDHLNAAQKLPPRLDQRRHETRHGFQNAAHPEFKGKNKMDQDGNGLEMKQSFNKRKAKEGQHQAQAKGGVRVSVENLSQPVTVKAECVPLKLHDDWDPPEVCVYPANRDSGASRQLQRTGRWENQELGEFLAALSTNSSLGVLDVGAGLGVYTAAAASMGHGVVAVEPLQDSQLLFTKTMQVNSLTERVVLVLDALGEKVGVGRLHVPRPYGNMGAVFVQQLNITVDDMEDVQDLVKIVRLDDVLPLVTFSSAVLKLDVQGDEGKVLQGAARFFSKMDVRFVLMHWFPTENSIQCKQIRTFLEQRGFEPAHTAKGKRLYSDAELEKDISFVVWRKRTVGAG